MYIYIIIERERERERERESPTITSKEILPSSAETNILERSKNHSGPSVPMLPKSLNLSAG
jgi:hypothetical protein